MELRATLGRLKLHGLNSEAALNRLIDKIDWSAQTRRRLLTGEMLPEAKPFCTTGYNPLGEARDRYIAGDHDEALWLHFVTTLIGWDRPDSVDGFLPVIGGGDRASWVQAANNRADMLGRLEANAKALMRDAPFGNHRKYETHVGERGSVRV